MDWNSATIAVLSLKRKNSILAQSVIINYATFAKTSTNMNNQYPTYDKEIKGLCPNKCSCDICRTSRKNDAGYQDYLSKKWKHELKIENQRTLENAIAHDNMAGKHWKGNASAVRLFQTKG